MPIYEYKCASCDNRFEVITLSVNKSQAICPSCKNKKVTKLISRSYIRPDGIPKGKGGFEPPSCSSSGNA